MEGARSRATEHYDQAHVMEAEDDEEFRIKEEENQSQEINELETTLNTVLVKIIPCKSKPRSEAHSQIRHPISNTIPVVPDDKTSFIVRLAKKKNKLIY